MIDDDRVAIGVIIVVVAFEFILAKEYKFVTEEELKLLKDSSEDYTKNTLELEGYVLGYDKAQLLVWLEDTPVLLNDKGEEE